MQLDRRRPFGDILASRARRTRSPWFPPGRLRVPGPPQLGLVARGTASGAPRPRAAGLQQTMLLAACVERRQHLALAILCELCHAAANDHLGEIGVEVWRCGSMCISQTYWCVRAHSTPGSTLKRSPTCSCISSLHFPRGRAKGVDRLLLGRVLAGGGDDLASDDASSDDVEFAPARRRFRSRAESGNRRNASSRG